jgi:Basic region leucine zipper
MSAYRGRTGPNFSEYLNNLNTLTSPYEEEQFTETLDLNQDLAMFTNTDFTHFEIPTLPDDGNFNFDLGSDKPESVKYEELLSGPDQPQAFNAQSISSSPVDAPQYYTSYNTPIQPAPAHGFAPVENHNVRRRAETSPMQAASPEEKSRVAAEEDKRRRNTAASARFRVKKKQREQALEKNVKEVSDKNAKLEAKLSQLEMENKWLKDLITEKNAVPTREEIDAAFQKFKRESEEREVEQAEHTTGVGTE